MKFPVVFASSNETFSPDFTKHAQPFTAGFGELSVVHEGQDGATFVPTVSADGLLSWTNDRGLPNPDPVNIKGADGRNGVDGKDGKDGKNGQDGRVPVKGTDYFTDVDKAEMVAAVIAALPVYGGETA